MKKIFFATFSLMVTAFTYQSCTPVDNTKAMAKADSTATSHLMMLRDSSKMACMSDVMNAAKMKSDSMMMAMQSHGSSKGTKSKPAPPPPPKSSGKLGDKLNEQSGGKLKDKIGTDTTKKSGKLKNKLGVPNEPPK